MAWLFWPVSVAVMSRSGRYLLYEMLLWPGPLAAMSRTGRYLPYGVAVLARIGGRYEPRWPLFAV